MKRENIRKKPVRASSHPRKRNGKKRGLRIFSRIPLWGYLLGGAAVLGIYCYVLFYFFVNPYSFQWKAIYGEPTYPSGYTVRGIDISHYQQSIDWQKLSSAMMNDDPVTFVIIKGTEGVSILDENFNENFYQAKRHDFVRGAYHYLSPDISASKQARFFLKQVHLEPGDLPPVLDIEEYSKWKSAGRTKEDIQRMALEWLDIVGRHYRVRPIIYSNFKFRQDILTDTAFNRYPFWVAHYYVEKPRNDIQWTMWQHTDCGRVDGIRGFVDCNIFNGDLESFRNLLLKEDE